MHFVRAHSCTMNMTITITLFMPPLTPTTYPPHKSHRRTTPDKCTKFTLQLSEGYHPSCQAACRLLREAEEACGAAGIAATG